MVKRVFLVGLLIVWIGFVLTSFFVVQKPLALQVAPGLLYTFGSLSLACLLIVDAAALGDRLLFRFFQFLDVGERLLLGTGLGLGLFGLLGFGLAAAGMATPLVMLLILLGVFFLALFLGWLRLLKEDFLVLGQALRIPPGRGLKWVPWLAGLAGFLTFLLAFAPPADSFDALLYHLTVPAAWLKDGGLSVSQIFPHYWFPALVEGVYVWGLTFGSETLAPLVHFAWGLLTLGLIWWWARKAWSNSVAWRSIAVLLSMPSLPLLASWAYTDLALAFYTAAVLYLLWLSRGMEEKRVWVLSGLFCGLAMGVKYTSFVLPLLVIGWMLWSLRRRRSDLLSTFARFAIPAILVASPWYLKNWILVGNPFYPFVFGGRYWDSFLAAQYAQSGTGFGLNLVHLFLLPLNLTQGQFDANYFDGRIGPLWLILFPLSWWVLWSVRRLPERRSLHIPALFATLSLGIWVFGVMNTSALWQSRLLFPALLPLAPLSALAWEAFSRLDTSRFRLSFFFNSLAVIAIIVSLLDFGLFVVVRNPLAAALGMTSRQAYFERFQAPYADALALVDQAPLDAHIYFLFEPRSYGMTRSVSPDAINQNLAHAFYIYHTPERVLQSWRDQGVDFVLYQRAGDGLLDQSGLDRRLFSLLELVEETPNTILYRIPAP